MLSGQRHPLWGQSCSMRAAPALRRAVRLGRLAHQAGVITNVESIKVLHKDDAKRNLLPKSADTRECAAGCSLRWFLSHAPHRAHPCKQIIGRV